MSHVSLYRKYRPDTFDKVVEQEHIVKILTNQISSGNISHSYLFTGTRGTGKTSIAKIFAKAINCLSPINGSPCGKCEACQEMDNPSCMDILEMDAASNNGVDDIRELRERVQFSPAKLKYKVFIIDEVHMLSASAFNALLKTLEEPPKYCVFILATTEYHKLPQTIISRCIMLDFRLISMKGLVNRLEYIFNNEGIEYEKSALELIATAGNGSVRDTLSVADMCRAYCGGKITYDLVLSLLGVSDPTIMLNLASDMLDGNVASVLLEIDKLLTEGKSVTALYSDITKVFIRLMNAKACGKRYVDIADVPSELASKIEKLAEKYSLDMITRGLEIMVGSEGQLRYASSPKTFIEMLCVRIATIRSEIDSDKLIARLSAIESQIDKLKSGAIEVNQAPVNNDKPSEKSRVTLNPAKLNSKNNSAETFSKVVACTVPEEKSELQNDNLTYTMLANSNGAKSIDIAKIWGSFITFLSDNKKLFLSSVASKLNENTLHYDGTKLVIEFDNVNDYNYFLKEENKIVSDNYFKSILGNDFNLEYKLLENKKDNTLDIDKIFNLFDSTIITKK